MRIPLDFKCCSCQKNKTDLEGKVCTLNCKVQSKKTSGLCDSCLQEKKNFAQQEECDFLNKS